MSTIIKTPRITEKASNLLEGRVYTFDITGSANKNEVKKAVFEIYKVKPVKVNVLRVPKKNTMVRGKTFTRGGGRKAFVYLKEGDKIEFI
ncbi:MAG: 50S ribosomal protein L23 [Patescibacteria group bacterium]